MTSFSGVGSVDVFRIAGAPWYRAGSRDQRMTGNAAVAVNINTLVAVPFWTGHGGVVGAMAFNINVLAAAGGVGRVGIYSATSGTLYPDARLVDAGQVVTDVGAGLKTAAVTLALSSNALVWCVYLFGVTAVGLTITHFGNGTDADGVLGSSSGINFNGWGWTVAQAYGALPATFPGGATQLDQGANQPPMIGVQYTSYS